MSVRTTATFNKKRVMITTHKHIAFLLILSWICLILALADLARSFIDASWVWKVISITILIGNRFLLKQVKWTHISPTFIDHVSLIPHFMHSSFSYQKSWEMIYYHRINLMNSSIKQHVLYVDVITYFLSFICDPRAVLEKSTGFRWVGLVCSLK